MSSAAQPIAREAPAGPSLRTRVAAVAVVVALGVLAAYAVFAGPTKIPVNTPAKSPARTVQPAGQQREPESEGVDRGD